MTRLLLGALVVAVLYSVSPVQAQDAASTETEAKALFDEAMVHLRKGRAAVGLDLLRRSLVLYPTVATRYNLGVALRLTGKTTESIATFQGLLNEKLEAEQRALIEEQIGKARKDLSTVEIRTNGVPTARLEIDGREVAEVGQNQVFSAKLDAGKHVVIAHGYDSSTRKTIELERGATTPVELTVIPLVDREAEQRRKRRVRWMAGSAGVAIAAVILTAVLVTRDRTESPPDGGIVIP